MVWDEVEYDCKNWVRLSTTRSLRALARESPEERETRRRANAYAMREARARESREEGETRWRANAEAMREPRARESREERETWRRANADAMREAWARRIADRGWQTLPVHRVPHPHPLRLGGTHECPHCHAVLLKEEEPSLCCRERKIQLAPLPPLPRGWSHICPLAFRKYYCSRPNVHTKVAEASEASNATCSIH